MKLENICIDLDLRMTNASILTHTDFKVKRSSHGAGAYCGGHLAAQLVLLIIQLKVYNRTVTKFIADDKVICCVYNCMKI